MDLEVQDAKNKIVLSAADALAAISGDHEDFDVIEEKVIGVSRWSIYYGATLQNKKDQKFYGVTYSTGATEMQDEYPFQYEDEVIFEEVFPVQKVVTVYV